MQVVIEIPENEISTKQDIIPIAIHFMGGKIVECDYPFIELEQHGRLIDADALNRKDVNCANVPMNFIDAAPTIIEANKSSTAKFKVVTRGNCMICGKELTEGLFLCEECKDKASSRK